MRVGRRRSLTSARPLSVASNHPQSRPTRFNGQVPPQFLIHGAKCVYAVQLELTLFVTSISQRTK